MSNTTAADTVLEIIKHRALTVAEIAFEAGLKSGTVRSALRTLEGEGVVARWPERTEVPCPHGCFEYVLIRDTSSPKTGFCPNCGEGGDLPKTLIRFAGS